jgi:hypothetical protein
VPHIKLPSACKPVAGRHEIAKTSSRLPKKIMKVEKSFKGENFCGAKNNPVASDF